LEAARERGFLGDGSLDTQVAHALGFAAVTEDVLAEAPAAFADLGAGGGVPGLVLAWRWPESAAVLLEANRRRCLALELAVERLGWSGRVRVACQRVEEAARGVLRGSLPLVVARSFGSPAATAECAAPLLRPGGLLVVSEPPLAAGPADASEPAGRSVGPAAGRGRPQGADAERWPPGPLGQLGLRPLGRRGGRFGYQVLVQERPCPERFPRRVGVPAKRPLY
jgi:16S rRNA (guanine527-N7)-methyltransferase